MKQPPTPRSRWILGPASSVLGWAPVAFALLLGACDDRGTAASGLPLTPVRSDAGGSGGAKGTGGIDASTGPSMVELQCRNLFLAICARDTSCGDAPALTAEQCLAQFATDCSAVVGVSPTYDACIAALPTATCPVLMNVPKPCLEVLLK
jgi:hypothetical protein